METSGEVATVTGTITPIPTEGDPISDSTTVICTDYSISVKAEPPRINPGGVDSTSIITAKLLKTGNIAVDKAEISFSTDKGSLSTATATTDSDGIATVTLSGLLGGNIATITASYEITTGNLISDTATVQCTEYVINIIASPDKIIPGSPSTITATLTNYEGIPASGKGVAFITSKGLLSDDSV